MRFVVLGPVQATISGQPVRIDRAQRRAVLAFLLLKHARTVSADEVIDALWGARPPATARAQVSAAISAVRRALRAAGHDAVSSSTGGYRLHIVDDELDLVAFDRRVEAARLQAPGSARDAAATMRTALRLWQGTPLSGITADFVEAARSGLQERQTEALERLYDYELAAGRHQSVLPELTDLAAAHPFREPIAAQLMLALHRSGRSAEALAVFRHTRDRFVAELGIEPGSELDGLHQQVLKDDPTLRLDRPQARTAAGRRYLPRDIPDFTGRADALQRLDELADEAHDDCGAAVVSAIGGAGGIGKTALATRWAHRSQARYPDGQLYLNLRGYDTRDPMRPAEALGLLLRALDVPPDEIPFDVDEMAAVYRAALAGQRMLILLDNARSVDQVRPLLPAGPGTFVLVTSRDALIGLVARDGARRIDLDVLHLDEAVHLLANIIGAGRVSAEPGAARDLAASCGQLPLALRIAAAKLAATPSRSIVAYNEELATGMRMASLGVDGDPQSDLQNVFSHSYRALPGATARVFRLLGLLTGADFTVDSVAALAGTPLPETNRVLTMLRDAYLVTERPAAADIDESSRYFMHDLVREYAAQLAGAPEHERECRSALDRLADWTDRHVQGATAQLYPSATRLPQPREPIEFADPAAAGRWLEAERENLTALVMTACDIGRPELAWRIPFACRDYLFVQAGQAMMIKMGQAGLAALAQRPDPGAEAAVDLVMAQAHNLAGQDDRALRHAARCLAKARAAGWRRMEIDAYNAMSVYHLHVGDLPASAHTARLAVDLSRDLGAPTTQHLGKLGLINLLLGRLHQARGHLEQTLQSQSGQANHSRGITLLNLADVDRLLGDTAGAGERIAEAIGLFEKIGSVHLAGVARCTLVHLHLAEGRTGQAKMVADAARANLEAFNGAIAQAQLCHAYGLALAACGLATEGLTVLRDGLAAAAAMRNPHPAIQLMIAFGEVERIVDNEHAVQVLTEAAARARASQFAVLEAQALDLLAAAHLDQGRRAPARRAARRALDLAQRSGYAGTRHAAAVLESDNH